MPHYNVLFLCTGNSARSIMAEAILNFKGKAGSRRTAPEAIRHGKVRPEALLELEAAGLATGGLRSKSWEEFAKPGAPELDFVFTVCDNAAKEVCPVWPGHPVTAHWGVADPAAVHGTDAEVQQAFREAFVVLERRIDLFLSLPHASLDGLALKKENRQHRTAMNFTLPSRAVVEFGGTAFLLMAIVGSGIMAERLSAGNIALALLANSVATGAALVALILALAPISGAHFNPVVTLADAMLGGMAWREAPVYITAQIAGAFGGVAAAHAMFGLPLFFASHHAAKWQGISLERVCSHLRSACRDLGMRARPLAGGRICSRRLHYGGVLVYGFYIFREPSRHSGASGQRYVCGYSSGRRSRVHHCAVSIYDCRRAVLSMAGSRPTRRSGQGKGRIITRACGHVVQPPLP